MKACSAVAIIAMKRNQFIRFNVFNYQQDTALNQN